MPAATPAHKALASSVLHTRASVVAGSVADRAEARQQQRVPRHADDGLGGVRDQVVEVRRTRLEQPAPPPAVDTQALDRAIDRPMEHPGRTAVERVDAVDRRLPPAQTVAWPGRARSGTVSRRRSGGTPSSGRASGRGRSSRSSACHPRSSPPPRARSRPARRGPAEPRQRARSAHCRRRRPSSRGHRVLAPGLTFRPPVPGYATPGAS